MAKRRLLQWMRENLKVHASKIVLPVTQKKALDAAYKKASGLVAAVIAKKFPPSEMKVLAKWKQAARCATTKLQLPNSAVVQFVFANDDAPQRPDHYEYNHQIFLVDAITAAAVERWISADETYQAERKSRLTAYTALIDGASFVEDVIDVWPEAKSVLPAGSPLIPLGPEQIALVKRDQQERKAA